MQALYLACPLLAAAAALVHVRTHRSPSTPSLGVQCGAAVGLPSRETDSNSAPGPELSPGILTHLYTVNMPAMLVLAYDSLHTSPLLVLWISRQTLFVPTGCYDECLVV